MSTVPFPPVGALKCRHRLRLSIRLPSLLDILLTSFFSTLFVFSMIVKCVIICGQSANPSTAQVTKITTLSHSLDPGMGSISASGPQIEGLSRQSVHLFRVRYALYRARDRQIFVGATSGTMICGVGTALCPQVGGDVVSSELADHAPGRGSCWMCLARPTSHIDWKSPHLIQCALLRAEYSTYFLPLCYHQRCLLQMIRAAWPPRAHIRLLQSASWSALGYSLWPPCIGVRTSTSTPTQQRCQRATSTAMSMGSMSPIHRRVKCTTKEEYIGQILD
ncbi:hypothetical protein V8E55_000068 [Tylopilus felleus]